MLETIWLERRAGFAGDDKERLFEIDLCLDSLDLCRNGRIENVKIRLAKCEGQHLGAKRRAAHAHQQNIRKTGRGDVGGQIAVFLRIGQFLIDDAQPPEPFCLVVARPDGRVFCPNPGDLIVRYARPSTPTRKASARASGRK